MPKITKRVVDAIKPDPDGKEIYVADSEMKGFGVRMMPSGIASFVLRYRTPEGQSRRFVIGRVGTLTCEEARGLARDKLAGIAKGDDPADDRKKARETITVAELCDQYLEAARAGLVMTRFGKPKRASTVNIDEGRVGRHIKPTIGRVPVSKLTAADLQTMVDAIAKGRTAGRFKTGKRGLARVSGGAGTAARVSEFFGGIWTWAEKRALVIGPNPAHGLETAGRQAKNRTLTIDELLALGKTLKAEAASEPLGVACVRLIALTALRRDEAANLRWREVDFATSCLRLEDTKTGRSMRPIGEKAVEHLRALYDEAGEDRAEFVFPARRGAGAADLAKNIADLFDAAGLRDARAHDLRRTFASIAADEGYSDATIGELLGHARRGVTAVHYIRRPDAALVAAADRVAARIAKAFDSKPAKVVELQQVMA